jgi:hypothetical protein
LIPKDRWPSFRPELCLLSGRSADDAAEQLDGCRAGLGEVLSGLEAGSSCGERVLLQAARSNPRWSY